jgi:predicted ATPase
MIHRAKFQNFKALRDVEITFDSRLTVLVGPNGSGKTSVLQGIQILSQSAVGGDDSFRQILGTIGTCMVKGAPIDSLRLEGDVVQGERTVAVIIQPTASVPGEFRPVNWHGSLSRLFSDLRRGQKPRLSSEWYTNVPGGEVTDEFGPAALLRLNPQALANPCSPNGIPPTLAPTGDGLAAVLAYLALNQPEQLDVLAGVLRSVIPQVEKIRFDLQEADRGYAYVMLLDVRGTKGVPANLVSSGTLLALALLTAIMSAQRPKILLCDDLDHGLHPKAQMELIGVLRKLLVKYPDLQIVATSHSPYILNQLEWNEVWVTGLRDDGTATCARLADHPEVEKWREAMTPGEFWSHVGDDWVKKLGKPQPEQPQPAASAS